MALLFFWGMVNTVKIRTKDTEDYSYEIDRKNNLPGSLKNSRHWISMAAHLPQPFAFFVEGRNA